MANGHGGKRPGAGRKFGSFGAKKREALAIAAGDPVYDGRKPRDILRNRMNALWEDGSEEALDKAVQIAAILMPYEHPRLSAVDATVENKQQIIEIVSFADATPEQLAAKAVSAPVVEVPGDGRKTSH